MEEVKEEVNEKVRVGEVLDWVVDTVAVAWEVVIGTTENVGFLSEIWFCKGKDITSPCGRAREVMTNMQKITSISKLFLIAKY